MSKKIRDYTFSFIFFIFQIVILSLGYKYVRNLSISEEKNRYKYIAINEANYISSCMDKVIVRTYTLREMINENNGRTDFFGKVAPFVIQSIKEDTGITVNNFALAPDGIITKVEPLANNEVLIGLNYADDSLSGNTEAMEAKLKSKTIITNPFNLIQGGTGMSARTPVYLRKGDTLKYWGLVSATMNFDDILHAFNFENFAKMHMYYKLWYLDGNGQEQILSTNTDTLTDAISEDVKIYNLVWHLDLCPQKGWKNKNIEGLATLVIVIVSAIVSAFVLLMFRIRRDGNKMRTLAEQDNLTHCYSRYYLNSIMLDSKTENWRNPENNYSVAIVDIDKFKYINDTYGHTTGDRALVSIADILKKIISNPSKDRIVRFGGDEFIIFFSNIERKSLRIKFQDILSAVEKITFEDIPDIRLTISMGVAIPEELEDKSYKNMIKIADDKLYQVKENGRNNYLM